MHDIGFGVEGGSKRGVASGMTADSERPRFGKDQEELTALEQQVLGAFGACVRLCAFVCLCVLVHAVLADCMRTGTPEPNGGEIIDCRCHLNEAAETDTETVTYCQQETDDDHELGNSPHKHSEQDVADVQGARDAAEARYYRRRRRDRAPPPRCAGHHSSARHGAWLGRRQSKRTGF